MSFLGAEILVEEPRNAILRLKIYLQENQTIFPLLYIRTFFFF